MFVRLLRASTKRICKSPAAIQNLIQPVDIIVKLSVTRDESKTACIVDTARSCKGAMGHCAEYGIVGDTVHVGLGSIQEKRADPSPPA